MAKAVYIHIPFCRNICSYCDFCKFLYNEKWAIVYLDALKQEIMDRYLDDEIKTIYIGGGTPSLLNKKELEYLFKIVEIFKKTNDYEFTFECNIEDINKDLLSILKANGVNRLSIGVESFNPQKLEFMNRKADFLDTLSKINLCREYGFNNINVDLIYAIPGETLKDLKEDLKLFLKLKVEHISTYSLMIEDHTKLKVLKTEAIDEELDYLMFLEINKALKNYHHYEISNFALPGYESKHNLTYWYNEEYYGFGLGASGYILDVRYDNTKNLKKYLLKEYVANEEIVKGQEKMNYEVMLGLRLRDGINLAKFKEKYGLSITDAYDLTKVIKNKDLIIKNGYIYINPGKIYVMNEILLKFL